MCASTLLAMQASGVIMVYDPNIRTQERDIELWHKAFVQPLKLSDSQVSVLVGIHGVELLHLDISVI